MCKTPLQTYDNTQATAPSSCYTQTVYLSMAGTTRLQAPPPGPPADHPPAEQQAQRCYRAGAAVAQHVLSALA